MNNLAEGWTRRRDAHSATVNFVRESLEVIRCSETGVELGMVSDPIAVIWITVDCTGSLIILRDGTDPNCKGVVEKTSGERGVERTN